MGRLFGTDGVRGLANADLTPELAMAIAASAARTLTGYAHDPDADSGRFALAIVGRDPRASGEMLESAVVAGLASMGMVVIRAGVLPTPGLAYLVNEVRADFGVMISASHNPMPDNGIKLFAAGGAKLPDEVEDEIEAGVGIFAGRPTGAGIGRVHDLADGTKSYVDHLVASAPNRIDGLKVVVDCANGAAFEVAPAVYEAAGAEVIAIHAEPDGFNINDDCGSTHLDAVRAAVAEHGADLGIAHDGDADRCLAVAADGTVIDGDRIMAILALALRDAGHLADNTLVVTVMSNLGLKLGMAEQGIKVIETKVGDRYVLEALLAGGYSIGGEQSGHVVLPAYATTGDGVLTALHVMARMKATDQSLMELASVVSVLPQILINVKVSDRSAVAASPAVQAAVDQATAELGANGRVLLRPSGTEPLVRVMVEAPTEEQAQEVADRVAAAVRDA